MVKPDIDWSDTNWPLVWSSVGCLACLCLPYLLNMGTAPRMPAYLFAPGVCLLCGVVAWWRNRRWPLFLIPLFAILSPLTSIVIC